MNSQDKWFVSKLAAKTVRRVAVFVIIATSTLSITHAQTDSWYFEFGAGPTFSSELSQSGFNFDTSCYPGRTECQPGNGYRWFYQIPTDPGFAFRVGAGKEQGTLVGQNVNPVTDIAGSTKYQRTRGLLFASVPERSKVACA